MATGMRVIRLVAPMLLLPLPACPPPAGPGAPMTATAAGIWGFTATVTPPPGPPTWTYTIVPPATGMTGATFVAVDVITSIDVNRCTFVPPATPAGWSVARMPDGTPTGFGGPAATTVTFSITCPDSRSGPVYLIVNRAPGTIPRTIGPIAGPV